eukprot:m.176775 g.176775  ORF g.176775 m.176775 type:complete len:1074 (+) comp17952_c4_seq1:181-3402(+)
MAITEQQAMQLLNFETERIDVPVLEAVLGYMNHGNEPQKKMAQEILLRLKESDQAWTRVHQILEESREPNTRFFALLVLERVIRTQWKILPEPQREGMKNFIVQLIIQISSSFESLVAEKLFVAKLNMVLIEIVKHEWPHKWTSFITDIVGSSKTSESLCQNNLEILSILSEEIFDFSKGRMTQVKAQHLKDSMCSEFAAVFELCQFVMQRSTTPSLITACLKTLLNFLSWIPIGYIFQTDLIPTLVTKFLTVPLFANVTLKCLAEIAALKAPQFEPQLLELFKATMAHTMESILPPDTHIRGQYPGATTEQQHFVQNLGLFLSCFLREHGAIVEASPEAHPLLLHGLDYLVRISEVDEPEIFKICLEYWNALAASLYTETVNPFGGAAAASPLMLGAAPQASPRRMLYAPILSRVRLVMISKMAKPEEVLVVENDQGEAVRETMKDTDSMELYKNMRETLVYLCHLDYRDTEELMTEKLQRQVNGSEWSWYNLNTLCWAIGSISGAMSEDDEKRFLVIVIKELLGLCEVKRGKDHKAIIASNIMYIVGQYPRFLRAHWKFLKTVVNKLFEFMHETHEGVQDMACDTFIKIAQKCKKHFVQQQVGEHQVFIEEILTTMPGIICDLEPHQIHTFYEAVGHMVAAQDEPKTRTLLIEKLMQGPNMQWANIIAEAHQNIEVLSNPQALKSLANILKTNVSACRSIGSPFVSQLAFIYMDMLKMYKVISERVALAIHAQGELITKQPVVQSMRTIKKEVLKLISAWISKSDDPIQVVEHFVPPLLEAVLGDYEQSIPAARDPEVLSAMATIVNTLQGHIVPHVLKIFGAVFDSTLSMINTDFANFPEHRTSFYLLLQAIVSKCFSAFADLTEAQFAMVVDAIVWGFKHPMRNVADTSLKIMKDLLDNITHTPPEFSQPFYSKFYLQLLQHVFSVVTDSTLHSGLNLHSIILAHLFSLVEMGQITVPLQTQDPSLPNEAFVVQFVSGLLKTAFPHLLPAQLEVIVRGFFSCDQDPASFKSHLRDFLVQCKEVAGHDLTDLYLAERQTQLVQKQSEKQTSLRQIPGMVNPHEMSTDLSY